MIEGFAKPDTQIKKFKICLLFVGKFVHNTIIDCISRLNQTNFNSCFFTHRVLQSLLIVILLFNVVLANSKKRFPNQHSRIQISEEYRNEISFRDESELNAYIESVMADNYIPGISVSIVNNGEIVWGNDYGYANVSDSISVTDSTLFLLSSVSKTITATALMQLWEDQYFELDDPINNYLPFTVNHPDYTNTPITFKMLLTHTSGIKDRWDVMTYYDGDPELELGYYLEQYLIPGGEFYNANGNFTNFQPGTNYRYSNIGVGVIGYLVEVISGLPFNEYCNQNIFEPLGMENTAWFLYELEDSSQIAIPYELSGGSGNSCYEIGCGVYDENNPCACDSDCDYYGDCCSDYEDVCGEDGTGSADGAITLNPINHYGYADYPSGQLRSTAYDLSKIMAAYMNNGLYQEFQLLEENTIELIKSIPFPDVDPVQGLIWYYKNENGRTLFGHNGGDIGSTTEMFISYSNNIGVIVLCNIDNYNAVTQIENALFNFGEELSVNNPVVVPSQFKLFSVYPNPFNPSTTIRFNIQVETQHVGNPAVSGASSLRIYDITGRVAETLVNEKLLVGEHEIIWNASRFSSGIYFVRLELNGFMETKKIVLVK